MVTYAGLQGGSPDGLALVNASGQVVQFLSYEGSFTATDGAAVGLTATDIGLAEPDTAPKSTSLQLRGTGNAYAEFYWVGGVAKTNGAKNTGQTFVVGLVARR